MNDLLLENLGVIDKFSESELLSISQKCIEINQIVLFSFIVYSK